MITKNQKRIIWTMVRRHKIDENEFRDWLASNFGKRSTRKLTESEADEVIRLLKIYSGQEYRAFNRRTWGITQRQIFYVKRLVGQLGWDDPKRLDGLVKKMFYGKTSVELLNKTEGTKLIVALEKMAKEVESGSKDYT